MYTEGRIPKYLTGASNCEIFLRICIPMHSGGETRLAAARGPFYKSGFMRLCLNPSAAHTKPPKFGPKYSIEEVITRFTQYGTSVYLRLGRNQCMYYLRFLF